jgi:cytochrome c553
MASTHRPITWGKRILLMALLMFVVIQFVPRSRWDKQVSADITLVGMTQPPAEVTQLLEVACYDCHAYGTEYPWYANVAPVSFWIDHHVEEGRDHLNFSEWASYSARQQRHKLEECAEEVAEGEMPLNSYTWMHSKAQLSQAQRETLSEWFRTQMQSVPQQSDSEETRD